jgi:tyrosyl-tRNA synthetase
MRMFEEQHEILRRGTADVFPAGGLEDRLRESASSGRPLRVKLGLDPTAAHVTLGWTVVLRKLRQFQDLGHTAVLIVGDFTARVGDPSGRSEIRKPLTPEQVEDYTSKVLDQFRLVLSDQRLEIRRNSEWLAGMDMTSVLGLTARYTVARMLERDDFAKRQAAGVPISVVEFLYPLMQGYDSVMVDADVELGGTDQTFNLLVGRDLQERYGKRPQVALTMPLLVGLDGEKKMSQSLGNYVGITEPPGEMFGKLMSLPDRLMGDYLRLVTDLPAGEVDSIVAAVEGGTLHPAQAKRRLAGEVVRMYHGPEAASEAHASFDHVHRDRALPDDVAEFEVPDDLVRDGTVWLPKLLATAGLAASNGEARRLIAQGGVRLDNEPVAAEELPAGDVRGKILQVGRRRFVRLR